MSNPDTSALAKELLAAYEHAAPVEAPLSGRYPDFDMAKAYTVEAEIRRLRIESGRRVTGLKVGYANKAMWRVLKLETLVWAAMYDDTVHDGAREIPIDGFMSPKLEPEVVFRLKHPLSGAPDGPTALAAVDWIALGFEIIDCPFPGWQFKPVDFVAAYGLHRALIVGEHQTAEPGFFDSLGNFKLKLSRNGQLTQEGAGKNSLRNPALCLAELARAAGGIEAGALVSSGTLTEAQPVSTGETWIAEADGIPLRPVQVQIR
jgi:2-keto-4-pentenoate hydratase